MKTKRALVLIILVFMIVTPQAKADFWSKLRDALIGGDSYSISSSKDENIVDGKIINPRDKREYRLVEKMNDEKENSEKLYRNFEGSARKTFYYECTINSGDFLSIIGFRTFYGYAKFPVYEIPRSKGILGCFLRDKSGKEKELDRFDLYLDPNLAMHIWDNQLTVKTIAMKNGKIGNLDFFKSPYFDSQNPGTEIFINGQKVNIK